VILNHLLAVFAELGEVGLLLPPMHVRILAVIQMGTAQCLFQVLALLHQLLHKRNQFLVTFPLPRLKRIKLLRVTILPDLRLLTKDLINILYLQPHLQHPRQRPINFTVILLMHILHQNLRLRQFI
jgi:hypothetical protein